MKLRILFVFLVSALVSCEEEEVKPAEQRSIRFLFSHYVGSQPLTLRDDNTLRYTNAMGNNYNVKSLRYFISKIIIYNEANEPFDVNMYQLVKVGENSVDPVNFELKNIPNGRYTRMSFVFGVDSARNFSPFGLENNEGNNSMEWPFPLGGGYHFMMLEGVYRNNNGVLAGYAIHLGKNYNQVQQSFPIDVQIEGTKSYDVQIAMNVDQWFDGENKVDLNNGFGYIMEDDAKQLLFKQNAERVFSVLQQ